MYGTKTTTQKAIQMLRQTAGTVDRTIDMVETGTYCVEVIQQIDSMIGTLHKAKSELLAGHLESCVVRDMTADKQKTVKELIKIYGLVR